ncbi:MAG: response regulator [Candidatus Omnitrophica bacterium]|nr:response regulator [Candidatus Omnitrophota bacterium]
MDKIFKITLIDDEKDLVGALKSFLEPRGFDVSFAYNGKDGMCVIKRENPDLVVMDITMPELDGRDLLSLLKKSDDTRGIPVIVLSAKDEPFEVEYISRLGVYSYLTKPYSITTLMKQVKGALGIEA